MRRVTGQSGVQGSTLQVQGQTEMCQAQCRNRDCTQGGSSVTAALGAERVSATAGSGAIVKPATQTTGRPREQQNRGAGQAWATQGQQQGGQRRAAWQHQIIGCCHRPLPCSAAMGHGPANCGTGAAAAAGAAAAKPSAPAARIGGCFCRAASGPPFAAAPGVLSAATAAAAAAAGAGPCALSSAARCCCCCCCCPCCSCCCCCPCCCWSCCCRCCQYAWAAWMCGCTWATKLGASSPSVLRPQQAGEAQSQGRAAKAQLGMQVLSEQRRKHHQQSSSGCHPSMPGNCPNTKALGHLKQGLTMHSTRIISTSTQREKQQKDGQP